MFIADFAPVLFVFILAASLPLITELFPTAKAEAREDNQIKVGFKSISEALSQPTSKYFWIKTDWENVETGIPESFYAQKEQVFDKALTFDVTNNTMQVSCGLNGTVAKIGWWRHYFRNQHSPGVWYMKDFSVTGPFSFTIKIGDETFDLEEVKWPLKTSLLDNIFPITELDAGKLKITLITYTPVSVDGITRLQAAIYGALIKNTSSEQVQGSVVLPKFGKHEGTRDQKWGLLDINFAGRNDLIQEMPYQLAPGEEIWVAAVFQVPGEPALDIINRMGTLYWLNSSWTYYRNLVGKLSLPEDPYLAEFFERMIYQSTGCINLDKDGNAMGDSCGTNCCDGYILTKDAFWYSIPFFMFDVGMLKRCILWFADTCIRPKSLLSMCDPITEGGVSHSLTISLMPVILSSLYYQSTGDKSFLTDTPGLKEKLINTMELVIKSRKDDDIWLFPSGYMSDFWSYGDYNTGANVTAWYCFKAFARVLDEVYHDTQKAAEYRLIADKVKRDLDSHNIKEGPFGLQYVEGTNRDGSVPHIGHEAEGCDDTIMSFYEYTSYDDPAFKNFTKSLMTEENIFYVPEVKGISPGTTTFGMAISGHVSAFASVVDAETMNGENGYLTELRKNVDLDGSLPWWPYGEKPRELGYGNVKRGSKSGYSSGVFTVLFVTEIIGIRYDAPTKTLKLRPFSPSSDFTWEDFKFGSGVFGVSYERQENSIITSVTNKNAFDVTLELEVMLDDGFVINAIVINDEIESLPFTKGEFLGHPTVKLSLVVPAHETRTVAVKK